MCKTLKVEVPASSHIPLTPRGLAGVQGTELPEAFGHLKSQTKRISVKFAPFPLPLYSLNALHRLRKIFNMLEGG